MEISDLLSPDAVIPALKAQSKKQLLQEESRWNELVQAIGRVMKAALAPGTEE